jgi:hypothetical protein
MTRSALLLPWACLLLWTPLAACGASGNGPTGDPWVTDRATGMNYNLQRGQFFDGQTTFCFAGAGDDFLDPMIMSYDHDSGQLAGPVKVGDNPLADAGDDHGNPAMVVDDSGYIHVMYGGHGDRGFLHHARSTQAQDIGGWTQLDSVEAQGTYPNLLVRADGTLFVFYRQGFHEADWVYRSSPDSGDSWSAPVALLQGGTERNDGIYYEETYYDSWYANGWGFYLGHDRQTIHAMFVYHAHTFDESDSQDNHLYQLQRKSNIYYARMRADGVWTRADGTELTLPITREAAEAQLRVFESTPKKGYGQVQRMQPHGISADEHDTPHLIFSSDDTDGRLVRWQGDAWIDVPGLPGRGFVIVTSSQIIDLYRGHHQYRTTDAGQSWSIARSIPEGAPTTGMLLQEGFHPDAKMLLFDWTNEQQPLYLWGDSGLVH